MRTTSSPPGESLGEILMVCLTCFGLPILYSWYSLGRRAGVVAFSDVSLVNVIFLEFLSALIATVFLWQRGFDLGRLFPKPTRWDPPLGLLLFGLTAGFMLAYSGAMQMVDVLPETFCQAMEINTTLPVIVGVSFVNAWFEEAFLIGYLQRALEQHGPAFALALAGLVRMLYHTYQGPFAAGFILLWGMMIGLCYWWLKRLWPLVVAHGLFDIIALS